MFNALLTKTCICTLWFLRPINCLSLKASADRQPSLAPELIDEKIQKVNELISFALGDSDDARPPNSDTNLKSERYSSARLLASGSISGDDANIPTNHQLVYGELSVPVLARLLDAVGVLEGDRFLDIGSGDGALVLGAALLYPEHISASFGVELVPGLFERSKMHTSRLQEKLATDGLHAELECLDRASFHLGNIYEQRSNGELSTILTETSLAVCFATTWSLSNQEECVDKTSLDRRRLPQLSEALTHVQEGARIVIVDGRLDENDGYRWEGDLKIECPDTAPHSIAALYTRL